MRGLLGHPDARTLGVGEHRVGSDIRPHVVPAEAEHLFRDLDPQTACDTRELAPRTSRDVTERVDPRVRGLEAPVNADAARAVLEPRCGEIERCDDRRAPGRHQRRVRVDGPGGIALSDDDPHAATPERRGARDARPGMDPQPFAGKELPQGVDDLRILTR